MIFDWVDKLFDRALVVFRQALHRRGRKELGLEGASRCYIWDGDWVITHVPRDKPYGRQYRVAY
jgi:hypothetical protein